MGWGANEVGRTVGDRRATVRALEESCPSDTIARMRRGIVIVMAVMLLLGPAAAATAYNPADNPEYQSLNCAVDATGASGAAVWNARLAAQLTPASAVVGAPVALTVPASSAPTFAVASSAALLATPDLAAGIGVPAATPGDYTFTTTFTTPGTIYWSAALPVPQTAGCPPTPDTSIARSRSW